MLMIETVQQVPEKVKQLQPLSGQFPADVWSRLNVSVKVKSVNDNSIKKVLCSLHEWLAVRVDPQWLRKNAHLPDCETDPGTAVTTTSTTASVIQSNPIVMALNIFIDMTASLEVARCIAQAHEQP